MTNQSRNGDETTGPAVERANKRSIALLAVHPGRSEDVLLARVQPRVLTGKTLFKYIVGPKFDHSSSRTPSPSLDTSSLYEGWLLEHRKNPTPVLSHNMFCCSALPVGLTVNDRPVWSILPFSRSTSLLKAHLHCEATSAASSTAPRSENSIIEQLGPSGRHEINQLLIDRNCRASRHYSWKLAAVNKYARRAHKNFSLRKKENVERYLVILWGGPTDTEGPAPWVLVGTKEDLPDRFSNPWGERSKAKKKHEEEKLKKSKKELDNIKEKIMVEPKTIGGDHERMHEFNHDHQVKTLEDDSIKRIDDLAHVVSHFGREIVHRRYHEPIPFCLDAVRPRMAKAGYVRGGLRPGAGDKMNGELQQDMSDEEAKHLMNEFLRGFSADNEPLDIDDVLENAKAAGNPGSGAND
jgi:hypothetical protein